MRVRDIMTAKVTTIRSIAMLPEAAQVMLREDVGALPVVDEGKLIGVITDRDIAVRAVAAGRDVQLMKVGDCLTGGELVTVSPETPLRQAEVLMEANQVRRLPVISGAGELVGIIGLADIAHASNEDEAGEVLDCVTEPGGIHSQSD